MNSNKIDFKEKKNVLMLLVLGLVIFLLGGAVGMNLSNSTNSFQGQKSEELLKTLSSPIIVSVVAYGNVQKIEGRNLTILSLTGEEKLTVFVKEGAQISMMASPASGGEMGKEKRLALSDIKPGQWVNVIMRVSPEGRLEAEMVTILSTGIEEEK